MDEINNLLKPDLCCSCTHRKTCRYYDKLTTAINLIPELSTSSDLLITAGVALDNAYISPFSEDVIFRNLPGSPIVGIVHCSHYEDKKATDEDKS